MVYGNTVNISEVPTILEPILNDTIIDTSAASVLDTKLVSQYTKIVENLNTPDVPAAAESGEVVKLFDE